MAMSTCWISLPTSKTQPRQHRKAAACNEIAADQTPHEFLVLWSSWGNEPRNFIGHTKHNPRTCRSPRLYMAGKQDSLLPRGCGAFSCQADLPLQVRATLKVSKPSKVLFLKPLTWPLTGPCWKF